MTDPTPGNNSATDTDTLAASADLAITKTDGVTTATPGGSVTYTITASQRRSEQRHRRDGGRHVPGVADLHLDLRRRGRRHLHGVRLGQHQRHGQPAVAAAASPTRRAARSRPRRPARCRNTATVTAPAGVTDPTPGNNSATDSDTLGASADLAITKTDGVTTATAGGSVTYTITASNAGPSNATGATVADTFPASLTCTWTCVGAGGGTCTASGSGNINDTVNLPSRRQRHLHGELHHLGRGHRHAVATRRR